MKVEGMKQMESSIRHLIGGMANMRVDAALATTLALAFAESWDIHVSTGIRHLQGAKVLVDKALTTTRQSNCSAAETARVRFLCNVWIYMDVIARLTSNNDELDDNTGPDLWSRVDPHGQSVEIDPLMGCASTLFPIVGRVANLVRKVRKTASNSVAIISEAGSLKVELEGWQPPAYFNQPEDPACEIQHSLQTAESYRWATLLYLHQAVPEIPSKTAGQLAMKVLEKLATVPLTSRTIIVQIYPLLAAGCEARNQEDRNWVRDRWAAMSQRMQIGNIDRCLEVVKEVWERRDRSKAASQQAQGHGRPGLQSGQQMPFAASPTFVLSPSHVRKSSFGSFDHNDLAGGGGDWDAMTSAKACGKRRAAVGEHGMPSAVPLAWNPPGLEEQDCWDQAAGIAAASSGILSAAQDAGQCMPAPPLGQADMFLDDGDAGALVDWPDALDEGLLGQKVGFGGGGGGRPKVEPRRGAAARKGSLEGRHELERERTVRGRQHWVGVMKEWDWEGGCLRCFLFFFPLPFFCSPFSVVRWLRAGW